MMNARDEIATILFNSFGGAWYISKGRATKHATAIAAAGFQRPHYLASEAESAALAEGSVLERTTPDGRSDFYVKRAGEWHSIDGAPARSNAELGGAGVWLALRRTSQ